MRESSLDLWCNPRAEILKWFLLDLQVDDGMAKSMYIDGSAGDTIAKANCHILGKSREI